MNKWFIRIFTLGLCAVLAAACQNNPYQEQFENSGYDMGSRTLDERQQTQSKPYSTRSLHPANHNNTKVGYDQQAVNSLLSIPGIGLAYVFVTDQNAYVAAALDNRATGSGGRGDRLSNDPKATGISSRLKQAITREVKNLHPEIQHVFISTHDDFIAQMNAYAIEQHLGRSLQPRIAEFNKFVQSFFANERGT